MKEAAKEISLFSDSDLRLIFVAVSSEPWFTPGKSQKHALRVGKKQVLKLKSGTHYIKFPLKNNCVALFGIRNYKGAENEQFEEQKISDFVVTDGTRCTYRDNGELDLVRDRYAHV